MKKIVLISILVILTVQLSFSQGRKFLRDKVSEWGSCKNVAMTLSGGDVALNGRNGYAAMGIPDRMSSELSELNSKNELIDDIVLTENGSWLILWGNNGIESYNCPSDLDYKIEQWNNNSEIINSITFNDNGDWIMISADKYTASNTLIMEWLKEGENQYGEMWAAHVTNTGMAVVYERGYKFWGDVPYNLKKKIEDTNIDVYRLKFLSDGAYFIADKNGRFISYF
jgi:hypothetical protein